MIKEKIDEIVTKSLERLLDDPEVKTMLASSSDIDHLLKVLMQTSEFQALLAGIRGLADSIDQINVNVFEVINTLKMHQGAIKNIVTIQDVLSKHVKSARPSTDISLSLSDPEKSSKPN